MTAEHESHTWVLYPKEHRFYKNVERCLDCNALTRPANFFPMYGEVSTGWGKWTSKPPVCPGWKEFQNV